MQNGIGPRRKHNINQNGERQLYFAVIAKALSDLEFFLERWGVTLPNFITYYDWRYCEHHDIKRHRNEASPFHDEVSFLTAYLYIFRIKSQEPFDIYTHLELTLDDETEATFAYKKIQKEAIKILSKNMKIYKYLRWRYKNLPYIKGQET